MIKADTMSVSDIYLISETLNFSPAFSFMHLTFITSGKKKHKKLGESVLNFSCHFSPLMRTASKLNHMLQCPILVSSGGKKGRKKSKPLIIYS